MPEVQKALHSATDHDIRAVLGPTDDEMVFMIQETGASKGEALQAFTWLNDDDYIGAKLKRPMNNRIRAVYDILLDAQNGELER